MRIECETRESTIFFTSANHRYEPFVLPYIASILAHNRDAIVEIVLECPDQFESANSDALEILNKRYPNRFVFRSGDFVGCSPNSVRFLETPTHRAENVYIGDIDILVLGHVAPRHFARMHETGLPYSNILRKNGRALSGLHFSRYDAHYPLPEIVDSKLKYLDEALLYQQVLAKGHPLPVDDGWQRSIHGFHMSLSRSPFGKPGWGLASEFFPAYKALRRSSLWQELTPLFDQRYQRLLYLLDSVLVARFHDEMAEICDLVPPASTLFY